MRINIDVSPFDATKSEFARVAIQCEGEEVIRITKDSFYVKGKKIVEDKKLYDAFVELFTQRGTYK